jgi:hypothetical protein
MLRPILFRRSRWDYLPVSGQKAKFGLSIGVSSRPMRGQYMVMHLPDTAPLKIVRILQGALNTSAQL